ncbi:cation:proton antiporter [Candidatus Uhrbacteria bacterium]|nr:cation:proton antiporter [Candidatus Uhrbacteria bacterium]
MLEELFFEIGTVLIIAAAIALVVHRLRQPLIIAYIVTGILVGPGIFALTRSPDVFNVMSQIGVAFLLFTVGLGLNWRNVKDVGGIALATGMAQVIVTSIVGFVVTSSLGFDPITSLYIAVAFSFSSTIIIVKLLMDKQDLDTLYGRISIGFLLVQDFIAMLILLGLSSINTGASLETVAATTLLKVVVLIPVLWFVSSKILPPLLRYVAKSQELLSVFAVAWCFLVASALVALGFGIEIGALIAGITLSGSLFEREINARIRPLRDFFLIIFFIVLGTRLGFESLSTLVVPTIVLSLYVLIGNPLIMMIIMRLLGYHPRTGFLAGTTVAQISEFSFIVIIAGIAAGYVNESALVLATAVGLVTITTSSFLIEHNDRIFKRLHRLFRWLEPGSILHAEREVKRESTQIFLLGYHRTGAELLKTIRKMKQSYTVVDFDPVAIRELASRREPAVYGDVGDESFLDELSITKVKLIISTIPNITISTSLLAYLKVRRFRGVVIVSAHTHQEAAHCYELGATYVIVPPVLSGKKFAEMLGKNKLAHRSWSLAGKSVDR